MLTEKSNDRAPGNMKLTAFVSLVFLLLGSSNAARLTVTGRDFIYNGKKVFLSGVNIAWNQYGNDFGNGQYQNTKGTLVNWMQEIANNGGNTVRMWVHVEGEQTPAFDGNGYVTGTDRTGSLISDMRQFLDAAKSRNLLVVFVLWNGALMRQQRTINLFYDDRKLQSYIDKALKPTVAALAGHPALAAWEILNEPEGVIRRGVPDSNPCFNTQPLSNSGMGWAGSIPMRNALRFVNWQADAIRTTDPGALVTVGSWSELAQTNRFRNYYSDECLIAVGGRRAGTLQFYQMHTYEDDNNHAFSPSSPFKVNAAAYRLNKPLVIGEFSQVAGGGNTIQALYNYAYNQGYQGAWGWQNRENRNEDKRCDYRSTLRAGMNQLRGKAGATGLVDFNIV